MPYLNLSQAKGTWERWQSLTDEHRLTVSWVVVTALVGLVFWLSIKVMPENPIVFRYFVGLYAIDSLLFFLIFRQYRNLGKTLLVFLVSLEVIVALYYGFNSIGANL